MIINKPYVLCAAIMVNDDTDSDYSPVNYEKGTLIVGRRYPDCIKTMFLIYKNGIAKYLHTYGFLTSDNHFVTRSDASKIALKAGQIESINGELQSEDLY